MGRGRHVSFCFLEHLAVRPDEMDEEELHGAAHLPLKASFSSTVRPMLLGDISTPSLE